MELLTIDRMLLHILAASGFMWYFSMCVMGHIFGGRIGSLEVD